MPRPSSLVQNVGQWQEAIDTNFGITNSESLRLQLSQLYRDLLISLAVKDHATLNRICEPNLARHFTDGLQWMEPMIEKLKLKGASTGVQENEEVFKEELMKNVEVRVVDYYHTFGAFIDRKKNKSLDIKKVEEQSNDNYGYYQVDQSSEVPSKLTQNIQLLLEVRTKLKLDVVDRDGRGLLETKLGDFAGEKEEVHYMLVENVMEEYEVSWKLLLKPFMNMLKLNKQMQICMLLHSLKKGWVITDFDGCLNGNLRE